ncbi:MAG: glycoside hydrolase family 3 N-terminal domain-containing protein [bacterium]
MIRHRIINFATCSVVLVALTLVPVIGRAVNGPSASNSSAAAVDPSQRVKPYSVQPSRDALKWADKELRRMSLAEKIGQLISVGINAGFLNRESEAFKELRRQIEGNHVGGIILFGSPVYESVILINRMQQYARLPLLVSADLERGAGMRLFDTTDFGWVMAVGATGNPEYARRMGEITGREARALGIQQILAPVVDVNNNAANPVINVRSFGEDPTAVGQFGAAFTKGAQGAGVIATAKHFPGHGNTATDSHRGLPVLNFSLADLNGTELIPFRAAIDAGVGSVMVAHIALPKLDSTSVSPLPKDVRIGPLDTTEAGEIIAEGTSTPASMSPQIVGILRNDLKFQGLVVTDALSMSGLTVYFTQEDAGVHALLAGADLLLKPADTDAVIRGLVAAVHSGKVTEKRIEESARKILAAKYDLGLVKERITSIDDVDVLVSRPEALQLANEIAEHAVTLVRNDAKLIPLKNLRADARIFNLAIINGETQTSPFVGSMARSGRKVETMVLDERSSEAEVRKALERAKGADLVIASLYGRVRTGQLNSIGLPEPGVKALNSILGGKVPVIGISFGNPYLLQNFPRLSTYLVAYGDMPALQQASARAILGEINVTGKLPITLPGLYPRGTGIQLQK